MLPLVAVLALAVAGRAASECGTAHTSRCPLAATPPMAALRPILRPQQGREIRPSAAAASASRLLALRGGADPVAGLTKAYKGIPAVTRGWFTLILASAALNQAGILAPEMVALDSHAIVRKAQVWRLVTSAAFFGGIGGQLLQKMYYLIQFGRGLEQTLGTAEYARTLASCGAMLCILFNLLGWQFTGDGLVMATTVLMAQQSPDAQMNMYGLTIPMVYMPFSQMVMSYLFSQQIPWNDIAGALVGYVHYYIQDEVKPDSAVVRPTIDPKAAGPKPRKLGAASAGGGKPKPAKAGKRKPSRKVQQAAADCGPGG
jgi:hypothetical protein